MESNGTRILLIEDNPGDARLIQEMLAGEPDAHLVLGWADTLAGGLQRLAQGGFDLLLLDLSLPDSTGIDTVARCIQRVPDLPIIVLTGTDDEALAIRAVQAGAQDYLVKGRVQGDLLKPAIRYALERHRMAQERETHLRALRTSEDRYRHLLDTMSDWAWEVDSKGVYTSVSGRCVDLLGYTPEEILGKTPFDLMPPEEAARIREIFETHVAEKKPLRDIMNWNLHKDGRRVCLLTNGIPLLDDRGGLLGYRGVDRDMTEREQAIERQTRQTALIGAVNKILHEGVTGKSEPELARTFLTVAEGLTGSEFGFVGEVNPNGRLDVTAMSDPGWDACRIPETKAVLMLKDLEIRGLFGSVIHGERSVMSNHPASDPERIGVPEGHPEIETFLGVRLSEAGKATGMIGLANKGSDYVPADKSDVEALATAFVQALMRLRAEEALAGQALQIERANEELRSRNAELDEFTYIASHDLQEPLRKMTSFGQLLAEDLGDHLPPQAEKDLAFIVDAVARMQNLVQDLLSLSRAGRTAMKHERVALGDCARSAMDALSQRIAETGAEVALDDLPDVIGDHTMLTQLYQNLLSNALKFRGSEAPVVRFTAERAQGGLVLGVRDNGIGIKPEYAEQIFAPFKRLHGRGEYEGTGIGLAICRKTVERHGGRIWVESEPGRGAHFRFTLDQAMGLLEEAA